MTLMHALIGLAVAGLIVGGALLLLSKKKKLPLPPFRILRAKSAEMSPQERAALTALAQSAVSRYSELEATPAELLTEIDAYCKKAHSSPDNTSRIILEKMLEVGSLQHARSYWQVHAFLDYRDNARKTRRA